LSDFDGIIASLELQRQAIERALEALREVTGTGAPAAGKRGRPAGKTIGTKRVLSPEGRKAIIAATKRRWAAAKKGQSTPAAAEKRGGLSAAGRKRLSDAMGVKEPAQEVWEEVAPDSTIVDLSGLEPGGNMLSSKIDSRCERF
jgi:hypothetical protein